MSKQPVGFRASEGTAAVFVRVPLSAAQKLDQAAAELGRPKRAIVAELLQTLDPSEPAVAVGRYSFRAAEEEVLTLEEAAALLRVERAAVEDLAERGKVPARKLGGDWRFSRRAILDWLAGS